MFIKTTTPDKIPNCFLWYDFSNNGYLDDGNGGKPSDMGDIKIVKNKRYQYINENISLSLANASNLCVYDPYLGLTAGEPPVWRSNGINGLGSALFGTTVVSNKNRNVLCTGYVKNIDYPNSGELYLGPINDSERTIFMVYQPLGLTGINDTIVSVDPINTSFSGTQLLPFKFGSIFNIQSVANNYIDKSGLTYSWQAQVSYINLLKNFNNFTYSVFNYLPSQGYTSDQYGYPVNDYNLYTPFTDAGQPTLFNVRCNDNTTNGSDLSYVDSKITKSTNYNIQTSEQSLAKKHKGTICTTDGVNDNYPTIPNTYTPPNSFKGIYSGILSIGNSSRFFGEVPTSSGMQSGITIPYVNPLQQCGFNGYIGEFIYYDRRLTDEEFNQITYYLRKKWNL